MRGRRLFLNDSTPYTGPTYPPNSPYGFNPGASGGCAPGTNAVDVGGDAPICLTPAEYAAYQQSDTSGQVNVTPKAKDDWTNWLIYGGLALFAVMLVAGGRR